MGATLDALHRLQAIESKLHVLRQRIEAKRREIRVQTRRLTKIRQDDEELHEKLKRQQADIDRLELERKGREEEIAKFREQMKITKTNKEYAALRVQINTLDANNRKLEDRILALMTHADELNVEAETTKKELRHQTERLERLERELAEIELQAGPQIEALLSQREQASYDVPPTALQVFERVAEHHESEAMAQIVRPHVKREGFICGGCQMTIPLEAVNATMNTDDIQTCNVCGRILYLEAPAATDPAATA